jgi:hypothetical protein
MLLLHLAAPGSSRHGGCLLDAEHYGFQLDDNPHDMALLPQPVLARALGSEAAAALPPAQAALHACGVPSWALLQVACMQPRTQRCTTPVLQTTQQHALEQLSTEHAAVALARLCAWRLPRRRSCDRAPTWLPLVSPSVPLLRPGVHRAWMLGSDGVRSA